MEIQCIRGKNGLLERFHRIPTPDMLIRLLAYSCVFVITTCMVLVLLILDLYNLNIVNVQRTTYEHAMMSVALHTSILLLLSPKIEQRIR